MYDVVGTSCTCMCTDRCTYVSLCERMRCTTTITGSVAQYMPLTLPGYRLKAAINKESWPV